MDKAIDKLCDQLRPQQETETLNDKVAQGVMKRFGIYDFSNKADASHFLVYFLNFLVYIISPSLFLALL